MFDRRVAVGSIILAASNRCVTPSRTSLPSCLERAKWITYLKPVAYYVGDCRDSTLALNSHILERGHRGSEPVMRMDSMILGKVL